MDSSNNNIKAPIFLEGPNTYTVYLMSN
jgi:hypothetical protein